MCAFTMCVCTCTLRPSHQSRDVVAPVTATVCSLSLLFHLSGWTSNTLKADDDRVARFFLISCPFKSLCKYVIKGVSAHTTSSVCVFVVAVVFSFCYELFPSASRVHTDLAGELRSAAHNCDCDPVSICVFVCLCVRVCIKWAIIAAGM